MSELSQNLPAPLPEGAPLPSRKAMRDWIIPLAQRTYVMPIYLLIQDYILFFAAIAGTVYFDNFFLKLLLGCIAGFIIGRIFIIGHDACHQSYTPNRTLNKVLGRIAFLCSLTPYSLWDVGHNVVHHGYTNLKGFDFVWSPSTVEEFAAKSSGSKMLERLYRSGWGPAFYYLIEMWWNKMFFPNKKNMPTRRNVFIWDGLLSLATGILWIGAMIWAAAATNQSAWYMVLMGFVVPFMFWNAMIGFTVYVHHTHTSVTWYDNKSDWTSSKPYVSTTVHLQFPFGIGALVHHIMEHTAHHLDMSVPLYKLKIAQARLEELLPGRIVIQNFSWKWYFDTAKRCKLYDFKTKQWLDFDGKPTAASTAVPVPAAA